MRPHKLLDNRRHGKPILADVKHRPSLDFDLHTAGRFRLDFVGVTST
jgi:hypothetical protein